MENLKSLCCPRCGSFDFVLKENKFYCNQCKAVFIIHDDSVDEKLKILFNERDYALLANLRQNLYKEVQKEHRSFSEIKYWCREIKKYYPHDFFANFYLACKDSDRLNVFLKAVEIPTEYMVFVLDYLLRTLTDGKSIDLILSLVDTMDEKEKSAEYRAKFETLAKVLSNR